MIRRGETHSPHPHYGVLRLTCGPHLRQGVRSRHAPAMRRRAPPDESHTVPNARPLTEEPEQPAEDVFASFLQRAYARKEGRPSRHPRSTTDWERSVEELLPRDAETPRDERDTEPPPPPSPASASDVESDDDDELAELSPKTRDAEGTLRVVLLTRKKTLPPGTRAPDLEAEDRDPAGDSSEGRTAVAKSDELRAAVLASRPDVALPSNRPPPESRDAQEWSSVVPPPSEATQRREAKKLVPDFSARPLKPKPAREASEDGLIPSGQLDTKLTDMAVLLRYGHEAQVARELEGLRRSFPQDLLLLRRIGEFWSESGRTERALETLFALASGLFERRNVEGMRQALEQAKQLDPGSERANRLLSLLDARPDGGRPDPTGKR
jgi:hypothetical protein